MGTPLLFVSSGDPSGDNATGRLIANLQSDKPGLKLFGLGGPKLRSLGQEQLVDSSLLAVLGFWEVAKRYFFFRRLFNRCVTEITNRRPSVILLVDYPGFNLRLAKAVKPLGIPVVYYISPQVWAWGRKRLQQIQQYVDRMLVILPFEETFYRENNVPCDFVGHYLIEDIPSEYIDSNPPGNRQIALLPGSRKQEVERMLPPMLEAARELNRTHGCRAVVAAVERLYDYAAAANEYADSVSIMYGNPREVIYESDFALTASGTATLECGIIGRPMVVVYKTGAITYQIAKRLVTLDKIALVNLVLGGKVVPELIQSQATSANMATEVGRYITDSSHYEKVKETLSRVPQILGGTGASKRAADIVGSYL